MVKGKLVGLAPMDRGEGEGQVKRLWSDGPHVAEKHERDLAPKERSKGEEQVRLRSMDLKSMWWFEWSTSSMKIKRKISCLSQVAWWICQTTFSLRALHLWNLDLHKAKVWNIGYFILPAMRCVEKIKIARFRFDSHTIKRGKRVLHYGYLVPLVSSNVEVRLVVSGKS